MVPKRVTILGTVFFLRLPEECRVFQAEVFEVKRLIWVWKVPTDRGVVIYLV